MSAKFIKCKTCGAEIASKAKSCPQCGAKNKKPFYKKWWFWIILVFVFVGSAGIGSGDTNTDSTTGNTPTNSSTQYTSSKETTETPVEISYAHYDVTELFDALSGNALKAKNTYKDQYVEIEGYLSVIDSDSNYISVGAQPNNYQYLLQNVQCYIKTKDQLTQVMDLNIGDSITVRGKIKDVGEILGYSLNIDSIG